MKKILAFTQNPPSPASTAGRRLMRAFGDGFFDRVELANTGPEVRPGWTPPWFDADVEHMLGEIRRCRPDIVLVFGNKAQEGLFRVVSAIGRSGEPLRFHFIGGQHPCSQRAMVAHHIRNMARQLANLLNAEAVSTC